MGKTTYLIIISVLLVSCTNERANKYYQEAYKLEEKDKYEEAIKKLDMAIEINPKFEKAYLDRAIDKSILEDYEGAISDLDILIGMRPEGIEPYVWRAEYKRMLGKYLEALKDAEIALKLKNPIIIDNIVVGAMELNYENQFIKNENFDIELEYILFERGAANLNLGNYKIALYDLDYCIRMNLSLEYSRYFRGIALLALGEIEKGCKDLRIASSLGNEDALKIVKEDCNL